MEHLEVEEVVLCPAEKAPLDEEFRTVKGNIEKFRLIVWPHVCNKINSFSTLTSCVKALEDKI
jgi:hypothetical protein